MTMHVLCELLNPPGHVCRHFLCLECRQEGVQCVLSMPNACAGLPPAILPTCFDRQSAALGKASPCAPSETGAVHSDNTLMAQTSE